MDTPGMNTETVISADNIHITDGNNREIIHGVSFDVRQGTIFGVFGDSGAGKTLIGRAVALCLPWGLNISRGEVRYGNRATPVTMVPQLAHASLPPLTSAQKLISMVLRWSGSTGSGEEVRDLLDKVGFPYEVNARVLHPHQLSGGLALRMALAAALAIFPQTLVLDEPTASLDPVSARDLAGIVRSLNADQKKTVIILSHDVQWARKICTDFLIIKDGRNVCGDDIQTVDQISDDYVKKFFLGCRQRAPTGSNRVISDIPEVPALEVMRVAVAFDRRRPAKRDIRGREKFPALFDISFGLSVGECLAVIGPSASGKTTLGLACAGLLAPHFGSVRHFGIDVYSSHRLRRKNPSRVFMVFQDPFSSINPRETVLSWLLKAQHAQSSPLAEKKDAAARILEAVNLSKDHLSMNPGQLSGGQCQRVAIAAGLLTRAEILVFDEPTSMLDPIAKRDLLLLLKRIKGEFKISCMVVTHDITAAMFLCESAIVLAGGRIVAKGSFRELEKSSETTVRQLVTAELIA